MEDKLDTLRVAIDAIQADIGIMTESERDTFVQLADDMYVVAEFYCGGVEAE